MSNDQNFGSPEGPIPIEINGELDLHSIPPRDVKEVIQEYLRLCAEKQIWTVRIIHGKGIGQMRELVHKTLATMPLVEDFHLAGSQFGGWGATVAHLKKN